MGDKNNLGKFFQNGFWDQKVPFYDPEIVAAADKNAIKTPFLAVLSPQNGMRGTPIGFWEKSNFFGSIGSLKGA